MMPRPYAVLLGLGLIVTLAGGVAAQPVSGLYVAGAGGLNLQQSQIATPEKTPKTPNLNETTPSIGAAAIGSVGLGFGNGWRMEVEGGRRR